MHYGQSFIYKRSLCLNTNYRSSFSWDCSMQSIHPEFHPEAFPHKCLSGMVPAKDILFEIIFLIYIKVLCKVISRALVSKAWSQSVQIQIQASTVLFCTILFTRSQQRPTAPKLCLQNQGTDLSTGNAAVLAAVGPSCRDFTHRDVGKGRTSRLCCSTTSFLEDTQGARGKFGHIAVFVACSMLWACS